MNRVPPAPPYVSGISIPMRPSSKNWDEGGIELRGLLHRVHAGADLALGEVAHRGLNIRSSSESVVSAAAIDQRNRMKERCITAGGILS